MNLLLDTCTVLWATRYSKSLTTKASRLIAAESSVIYVSAASAWEIATKVRKGKLPEAELLERDFLDIMDAAGYIMLPIDAEQSLRAGRLPGPHRDPFDRIIAAQALSLDIPVITPDKLFDQFGVRRIW